MSNCKFASFIDRAARSRGGALLRRFARRQDGAAAIEFAMVAAPFLALVFAIMETAIIFFAGQILETAASDSARLIMTGQAQTLGFDNATNFKTKVVCPRTYAVLNCLDKLHVDVKRYTSFAQASANISKPIEDGKLKTDGFGHDPSGPGDIVVVRLMYEWPVYVSLFGFNKLADVTGGNRLLMATVAFCNEPFGGTSKSC
jgi:Flp pilus assembly protein TadG